jgi:hypothetical protein
MGYMAHHALIVTFPDYVLNSPWMPNVQAFKEKMSPDLAPLLVGPVVAAINGYQTWAFLPDGSKEGWGLSDEGDRVRQEFADLFAIRYDDGSGPFDVAVIRFGGNEPEKASITDPRVDWRTICFEDGQEVLRRIVPGKVESSPASLERPA